MFERVYGHARIKELLARMVQREQVHHGLCFHGSAGIGKRLMAQQLAQAMLCEHRSGCGSCRHCLKFQNGNHPDYQEVLPDGADIKVDQIRQIADNLHFRPFEGRCRVIVLDGVERFREEAANAFLKSLEEPPAYVYFVLVASDVKALLPTIRSRCQQVAFQPLNHDDKTQILVHRFGKEARMAARLASISFRQLETDEEAWDHFEADTRKILTFFKLMLDEGHALDYLSDLVREKNVYPRFSDHMLAVTRELTLVARGMEPAELFNDFREELAALAARVPHAQWREAWEALVRLNGMRRLNLNLALWYNAFSVLNLDLLAVEEHNLKSRLAKGR